MYLNLTSIFPLPNLYIYHIFSSAVSENTCLKISLSTLFTNLPNNLYLFIKTSLRLLSLFTYKLTQVVFESWFEEYLLRTNSPTSTLHKISIFRFTDKLYGKSEMILNTILFKTKTCENVCVIYWKLHFTTIEAEQIDHEWQDKQINKQGDS